MEGEAIGEGSNQWMGKRSNGVCRTRVGNIISLEAEGKERNSQTTRSALGDDARFSDIYPSSQHHPKDKMLFVPSSTRCLERSGDS